MNRSLNFFQETIELLVEWTDAKLMWVGFRVGVYVGMGVHFCLGVVLFRCGCKPGCRRG